MQAIDSVRETTSRAIVDEREIETPMQYKSRSEAALTNIRERATTGMVVHY